MTQKFLDYVKSARLEAADSEMADGKQAESDAVEIRMTTRGFPIIPDIVMEKELKKAEWEKLLRAFLTQHYCEISVQFHQLQGHSDVLQICAVDKSRNRYLTAP